VAVSAGFERDQRQDRHHHERVGQVEHGVPADVYEVDDLAGQEAVLCPKDAVPEIAECTPQGSARRIDVSRTIITAMKIETAVTNTPMRLPKPVPVLNENPLL